ncbi:MAG: cytochrome P450 [Polyangiaceae bacterium]
MSFENTDLLAPATHTDDPEPFYEWHREQTPLYWDPINELWSVARYEDVIFVSKNPQLFCSGQGVVPKLSFDDWPEEAMINKDGDAHTKQRGLVSKGFTPRRVGCMGERAVEIVNELIDAFIDKGEADLVRGYARPLPMYIIGEMLGYPRDRMDEVLDWTDVYVDAGSGPDHITEEVQEAFANFVEFHEEILEQRKQQRGDDLISVWLDAELDGEKLSEEMLMFEHNLLLVGGSETTRNAISIGLWQLMKHPEQLAWLSDNLDNSEAVATAVEEMIRFASPFVRMRRTATQDYEWYGKTIKEGDEILMLYPAANRDPRVFPEPQKFDIKRQNEQPPLSFGYGKHFCLGASLARLEARTAIKQLLSRVKNLELAGEPRLHPSSFTNGLEYLPARFSKR